MISACNLTSKAWTALRLLSFSASFTCSTVWLALFMKSTLAGALGDERALPMAPPPTAPTSRVSAAAAPRRARLKRRAARTASAAALTSALSSGPREGISIDACRAPASWASSPTS